MTLAAGFRCDDGVVLCADTEITMPGLIKFPGSKIKSYQKLNFRPAFALAGNVNFCAMVIQKLLTRISGAGDSAKAVIQALEEEALVIHRTYAGETYEAESSLLMCLFFGRGNQGRRQLFEVEDGLVSPVTEGFIGAGQIMARTMGAELFRADMTVEQTALMAAYILAEAKLYGYGVGKDSQILLLYDRGNWNIFPSDPIRHASLQEIEQDYLRLKRALRPILLLHGDASARLNAIQEALDSFGKLVIGISEQRGERIQRLIDAEIERQQEEWREEDHSEEGLSPANGEI